MEPYEHENVRHHFGYTIGCTHTLRNLSTCLYTFIFTYISVFSYRSFFLSSKLRVAEGQGAIGSAIAANRFSADLHLCCTSVLVDIKWSIRTEKNETWVRSVAPFRTLVGALQAAVELRAWFKRHTESCKCGDHCSCRGTACRLLGQWRWDLVNLMCSDGTGRDCAASYENRRPMCGVTVRRVVTWSDVQLKYYWRNIQESERIWRGLR